MSWEPDDESFFRYLLGAGSVLLVVALLIFGLTYALAAEPLVGRVSVIDGDTIEIRGERVRFDGIDAPDSGQTCTDNLGGEYRCGQAAGL